MLPDNGEIAATIFSHTIFLYFWFPFSRHKTSMQKLLRWAFILILIVAGTNKSFSQCNPVINGEDTICAGSSSYLYVDDIYQSYSWSNGSTTYYTYATSAGTITLNTIDGA